MGEARRDAEKAQLDAADAQLKEEADRIKQQPDAKAAAKKKARPAATKTAARFVPTKLHDKYRSSILSKKSSIVEPTRTQREAKLNQWKMELEGLNLNWDRRRLLDLSAPAADQSSGILNMSETAEDPMKRFVRSRCERNLERRRLPALSAPAADQSSAVPLLALLALALALLWFMTRRFRTADRKRRSSLAVLEANLFPEDSLQVD